VAYPPSRQKPSERSGRALRENHGENQSSGNRGKARPLLSLPVPTDTNKALADMQIGPLLAFAVIQ
jgi:hypothetical protein